MKLKSIIASMLYASSLAATANVVAPNIAHATDSINTTCAAIDPGRGGAAVAVATQDNLYVTVVAGESITYTTSDGSSIDWHLGAATGPSTSGVAVTFSASGTVWYDRPTPATATATCTDVPVTTSAGTSDPQSASNLSINTSNALTNTAVNNAVSGAFQPDSSSGAAYVAANGFALSTRGLAQKAQNDDSEIGYGYNGSADQPWNFWASGQYDQYEGTNNSFNGYVGNLNAGVDYKVNDTLLIGLLAGYSKSDIDTLYNGTNGSLKSSSYSVGTYLGAQTGGLTSSAYLSFTRSNYDVVSGTDTGSFDADRYSFGFTTYGTVDFANFILQPTAAITYSSEKQAAYTDSAANSVAANTITSGRLSLGPKFVFNPIQHDSGETTPWAAVNFDHDFSSEKAASSGTPDLGNTNSGSLEFGFMSKLDGGASISATGRVGGLGSNQYTSYGGSLKLSIPIE